MMTLEIYEGGEDEGDDAGTRRKWTKRRYVEFD